MHTIEVNNLKKKYSKKKAVDNISLKINTGEIVGLLGPNGAGKTTTFYIIIGFIRPDEGAIFIDNENISNLPMYVRARMGIGYLPQESSIFRRLTVRDNIRAVLEVKGKKRFEIEEETESILDEFHLRPFASRKGLNLSGGERRRTEIARAIATDPVFILFDEPFAGIDPIAIKELKNMLTYLKNKGLGILITDHNVRDTLSITDRAYIISHGNVLDEGTPDKITNNPVVKEEYLGEEFTL